MTAHPMARMNGSNSSQYPAKNSDVLSLILLLTYAFQRMVGACVCSFTRPAAVLLYEFSIFTTNTRRSSPGGRTLLAESRG